ncbi:MAG: cysteine--tRNA ligase [Erysipelotrichaceae bacterium]|nr:cysteine--tRNA ligase [Erysipelotrichaceae bacterium]MDD3809093.1 cysteine--tRNA ligase [Erysipelotrichaceae bacterium]
MKLFNSLTNQKEEFKPIKDDEVSIYVCGPTVYNYVHIGNTRPMIVFDVLRRMFEYYGYNVVFVSNFTDVDDKIIAGAKNEGISEKELAEKYIAAYNEVREALNLEFPTYAPRVTENMDQIIGFIQELIDLGYGYVSDGDVYFRVGKVDDYGQLSKIQLDDLIAGASNRVDNDEHKESPTDFALWKKTDEGLNYDSPWSKGRPGWHSECVVMINDIFDEGKIDIHGGGMDLKFPHHENEIAQSMALHHHPIAHTWMHNQMININNEKMSKSKGNVLWAKDLVKQLGCNVYKWLMLSSHYRNPLNFTDEVLKNIQKEVAKVENVLKSTNLFIQIQEVANADYCMEKVDAMVGALADDLNTSLALTKILDVVKELNTATRQKEVDKDEVAKLFNTLIKMLETLGFKIDLVKLTSEDKDLFRRWNEAKAIKDFETADKLRMTLSKRGVI